MIDLIYYMFYCSASNDGAKSKHEMAAYGMEVVATQFFSFISFIIVGILNIKIPIFMLWLFIIVTNSVIAYFLIHSYYIKPGRYLKILEKYSISANGKKTLYKALVICFFIISFVLLFIGGVMMSYLFSLHE